MSLLMNFNALVLNKSVHF